MGTDVERTHEPQSGEATLPRGAWERDVARRATFSLIMLTAMHFVVDTVASQISPLWPTLEQHYHLPTFWMLFIWTLAGSFSQLGFALIGDRSASRWLVWLGPAVSCVCLGCLGLFEHFLALAKSIRAAAPCAVCAGTCSGEAASACLKAVKASAAAPLRACA